MKNVLYLIQTYSGKPVFYTEGEEEHIVRYTAVIQAIVSCFDHDSELRSIQSGAALIVMLNVSPLVLVAIDENAQHYSESQLRSHLELLHAQILSVLTKQQLEKHCTANPGMDIRPMLGGTEVFLNALVCSFWNSEPWTWLSALECLELRRSARGKLNSTLLNCRNQSSLLYALMVSESGLSGVLRPKQHSLHPPDLHLLFSMLFNTSAFREGEHWVPICFPKFNPNGFLYAYIRLVTPPHTFLVLVSPNKHGFFEMQTVANNVLHEAETALLRPISDAASRGRIDCHKIGVDPIKYFVYKSNSHVQFLQSHMSTGVPQDIKQQFAYLQSSMKKFKQRIRWRGVSGGSGDAFSKDSLLGWHTPAFELYCYASGDGSSVTADQEEENEHEQEEEEEEEGAPESDTKIVVSNAVKKLVTWIRKHETRLFIVDGATF